MKRALVGLLMSCVCACGGDDDLPDPDQVHDIVDGGAPADADTSDVSPNPIQAGATDGVLDLDFRISLSGSGSDQIGDIDIVANAGTIQIAGLTVDAVAYVAPPPFPGYDLYQVIAVDPDALYLVWLYCNQASSQLEYLYWEGTDAHPLALEAGTGACNSSAAATSVGVVLPPIHLPMPDLVQGFTIDGTELFYDGTPGTLSGPFGDAAFLPFETVDCSAACGTPGWWELHSVLWDSAAERVGFGIVYLFPQAPPVTIAYEIWFPDLTIGFGNRILDATWTMP